MASKKRKFNQRVPVYEIPFRPPYELYSAAGWGAASLMALGSWAITDVPFFPVAIGMSMSFTMGIIRFRQGYRQKLKLDHIQNGGELWFMPWADADLKFQRAADRDGMWYGRGFEWTPAIAEKAHYLLGPGAPLVQPLEDKMDMLETHADEFNGKHWLHHLDDEKDLIVPLDLLKGQTIIVGTTRSGKSRTFEVLIEQCVRRGEAVIIIDPKGDKGLAEGAKRACEKYGYAERYSYFHPAHPNDSDAIDVMASWSRATSLASRVAALIAAGGDANSDPFVSFVWRIVNNIVHGLLITGEKPNLKRLRALVDGGAEAFVLAVLKDFLNQEGVENAALHAYLIGKDGKRLEGTELQLQGYKRYYREIYSKEKPSPEIDGLLADQEHDKEHLSKMIVSLTPILTMLTSHPLDTLLSPDPKTFERRIITPDRILNQHLVVYVGLDTLSDTVVGQAIGSVLLAGIAAEAGNVYNYTDNPKPFNIFVDEGAEVLNQPLIQIANKGGGSMFRLFLATQTYADIAVRLGSKDRALQVIGNMNNVIALRIKDSDTQQTISDSFGKAAIRRMNMTYGHGVSPAPHDMSNGNYGESLVPTETDLFPADLFSSLPPLHFMAMFAGGKIMKCRVPLIKD